MRRVEALLVCVLHVAAAFGQGGQGTLAGTVSDPARGPVVRARLVLSEAGGGGSHRASSTSTGAFAFASLEAGSYELTVTAPGYARFVQGGLRIGAGETVRLDVLLQSGLMGETMASSLEEPLLATEGAEISTVVPSDWVDALPLPRPHVRNPLDFVTFAPGITGVAGAAGDSSLRTNGSPSTTYRVLLDGQDITNSSDPSLTLEQHPPVAALAEFKLQTGSLAAESGQGAGGFVRLRTKSGSYLTRGAVSAYLRNEALNAGLPFSDDGAGRHVKPRHRDYNYSASLSGPVLIPGLYDGRDGTYFHLSFEHALTRGSSSGAYTTVPAAGYRQGDFSAALATGSVGRDILGRDILGNTVYDPFSSRSVAGRTVRDPFPQNRIELSRLDPVALKLQEFIPKPDASRLTASGSPMLVNNLEIRYPRRQNREIPSLKIDHHLGAEGRFSAYGALYRLNGRTRQDGLPAPVTGEAERDLWAWTLTVTGDYSVMPSLVAHLGLGWVRWENEELPVAGVLHYPASDPVRGVGLAGGLTAGMPALSVGMGAANRGGLAGALGARHGTRQFSDKGTATLSLTYSSDGHLYKLGAESYQDVWAVHDVLAPLGSWNFGAAQTALPYLETASVGGSGVGFPYASFLLGRASSAQVGNVKDPRFMRRALAFYWQDIWKVTPRLTIDYGGRWSSQQPPQETRSRISMFGPTVANPSAGGRAGGMVYEGLGEGRCNCSFAGPYLYAFGPRLGVAWQITPRVVIRAGGGVSYGTANYFNNVAGGIGLGWNTADFTSTSFGDPAAILRNGLSYNAARLYEVNPDPGLRPSPGAINSPPFYLDHNGGRPLRIVQFNVSLQREILRDLVVESAYVGNRSVWNQANSLLDWNALTPERIASFGLDIARAADRELLISRLNSPLAASRGFSTPPYTGFPASLTVAQALRPYPQFGDIPVRWAPLGNTWYDSFQARLTRRFSGDLGWMTAFTWQKEQTLGVSDLSGSFDAINDVFNRAKQKTLFPQSRPLVFVAAFSYRSPAAGPYRWTRALTGGWTVAGFLRYQSGALIRIPAAANNLDQLLFRGTYANRVEGQPLFLADMNGPIDPSRQPVLNRAAWSDPEPGQWGMSSVYFNDYRGRRSPEESLGLGRVFNFREGTSLELRAEFHNVLNRLVLPAPASGHALAPEFGLIDTTAGVGGSRQGQLAALFRF